MISNDKRSIVECDENENLVAYQVTPNIEKLAKFREEQLRKVKDKIYVARATCLTDSSVITQEKMREYLILEESEIRECSDYGIDAYSSDIVGLSSDLIKKPKYPHNSSGIAHELCEASDAVKSGCKDELDCQINSYYNDLKNSTPFAVKTPGRKEHYFLPLAKKYEYHGGTSASMYALHLTGLAYLEQLFRSNCVDLFLTKSKKLGVDIRAVLDLYDFSSPQEIDALDFYRAEECLERGERILYGDAFNGYFSDDRVSRKPLSICFKEQAQNDSRLIGPFKAYLKTR